MDFLIVGGTALIASLLTFFSGFGLGTILSPVMLLFFPIEIAIAVTGVVHLSNNVFKIVLIGKHIHWQVILRFGITAIIGAFIGASLLGQLSNYESTLYTYSLASKDFSVSLIGFIVGIVMLAFAILELFNLKKWEVGNTHLLFGGALSGFFGGLSGHQGALRSIFLIKYNLSKEMFIATGTAIACLIDISRIGIYFGNFSQEAIEGKEILILTAILGAFIGAFFGRKSLKKVTIDVVQKIVAVLLIVMSLLLIGGIV